MGGEGQCDRMLLRIQPKEKQMIIGVPKEIKDGENRVAMTPAGAALLSRAGHEVLVESGAGAGSGYSDAEYAKSGAKITVSAAECWSAEMVIKVKEPLPSEYCYFRNGLILFTYLHLAADRELAEALIDSKVTAIAYETIQAKDGSLPLLAPMSEIAGRMSIQVGAQFLEKFYGGKGILLAGVPGVDAAEVVIIGGGIVGSNAARIALGMGAHVTLLDINPARLRYLEDIFGGRIQTLISNEHNIRKSAQKADLLVGAVLNPGMKAPCLVSETMVRSMEPGSVIVDVAVDQGGCIGTIDHATTHSAPTYEKFGVVHYAVANIPGAVARTSTQALTNATMPYAMEIAAKGCCQAADSTSGLAGGYNIVDGAVTCKPVADSLNYPFKSLRDTIEVGVN